MALRRPEKVVDFQDVAYGAEYLDPSAGLHALDEALAARRTAYAFTAAAANISPSPWPMTTSSASPTSRRAPVAHRAHRAGARAVGRTRCSTPPSSCIRAWRRSCGTLPAAVGPLARRRPRLLGWLDRRVNQGRRVRTYSLPLVPGALCRGGLRGLRRRSLRHAVETAHRDAMAQGAATEAVGTNYQLGVEILQCRRLVKGYSDTHSRGLSKFDRTLAAIKLVERRDDAADWARRLREAALKDGAGQGARRRDPDHQEFCVMPAALKENIGPAYGRSKPALVFSCCRCMASCSRR